MIEGNPFIGMFARASESLAVISLNAPDKFAAKVESTLACRVARLSVSSSNLVGLFCAINSRGAVLSCMAGRDEVAAFKKLGLAVEVLSGRLSAPGNNILCNDRAALINPSATPAEARLVADALGVEVIRRAVAGFNTVGSAGVATNKGLFVHGAATEEELKDLEQIFHVHGAAGTANMGVPFVGLCVLANARGYVAGEATSGFELARIDEAFGFV